MSWIQNCAINKDGCNDDEMSAKVVEMLKMRNAHNKLKRQSVMFGAIPLTKFEARLVKEPHAEISKVFLQHLAGRFPTIQKKCENNVDATRAKKMNEHVIRNHFYGDTGLQAAMILHKIMDATTKNILDPRRVWALDELGQFFEHGGVGPRPKAWGIRGEALQRSDDLNREQASIGIAFSLAGHIAGPQFNAARVNYTAGMTDCLMAPLWAKSFDNKVFAGEKRSTYSTMSKSANGVQTGVTFMQWIKTLRVEIDAFSAADVACGLPPIEFPVMLLSDNHGSRFDFDVLESVSTEEAVAEAKKLGLALWLEESKVSHFLQMPDRITKMCHSVYTKACKQYKKTHEFHYGYTCTIGLCEFLEIWGGCREMNYEGAWFSWCSPQTVLAAWRAVGFFPGGLDPTQIESTFELEAHFGRFGSLL